MSVKIPIEVETICIDIYGVLKSHSTDISPVYDVLVPKENNRKLKLHENITGSTYFDWRFVIIPNPIKLLNNIVAQSAFSISKKISCMVCNKIINPGDRYITHCRERPSLRETYCD